jgi:glycosyltransferase involved in cell wall biosynthesis
MRPDNAYALIIPALNESATIAELLHQVPPRMFSQILVVDNGSQDGTAEVARGAGAEVVYEPRRGYGQACLAGLARLGQAITAVVFMDGDLSDDPADLGRLLSAFERDACDLAIGSRVLGIAEPGALMPLQRFGNWLTSLLIRWIWHVTYTDLGPLRAIRRESLAVLKMDDKSYGWNVEMQAKAARLGLKVREIPVSYRRRRAGQSKISGTVGNSLRAGIKILWTVYRCWRVSLPAPTTARPAVALPPGIAAGPK